MSRVARIRAPRNASALRLLRVAFLLVAVGLPAYAVASRWQEVSGHLHEIGWGRAALCAPPMLAGLFCGMRAWRAILGGLGSDLPARPAARVYFVGQLGKYVPGAVWAVLAQMEFARDRARPCAVRRRGDEPGDRRCRRVASRHRGRRPGPRLRGLCVRAADRCPLRPTAC